MIFMLNQVLMLIVLTWFITVPLILEIIAWAKGKPVPSFFKYSSACKCCVIGYVITSFTINISIGYEEIPQGREAAKIYAIVMIILQVAWEIYKHAKLYKYKEMLDEDNTMILSVVVATYFGNERGYNIFKREHSNVDKEIWVMLKADANVKTINEDVKNQLKIYVQDAERKAINTKDAKLLSAVIKTKMKFLESERVVKSYYKNIVNELSDMEEHKMIREIVIDNPRMFKMI